MTTSITERPVQAIELALQSLKIERAAYVARLTAVLERADDGKDVGGQDVDGYLERIENINAAMIRLASVSMKH
jgi:hypothetical protein